MRTRLSFLGDLAGTSMRDEAGVYSWPPNSENPTKYMSVTSILSTLNKPGLNRWHAAKERDYVVGRLQAMKRGEVKGQALLDELTNTKNWTSKAEAFRNERADLGSAVHHAITRYVIAREDGIPPTQEDMAPDVRPFLLSFHKWFEQECPSYLFVEGPVFSREGGHAGTADGFVALRGMPFAPLDYKISPKATRDHALQLAAYRHSDFIGVKNTGAEISLPKASTGWILLVHEDGCHLHEVKCGEREYEVFMKTQDVHRWRNFEYEAPKEEW